MAEQKAREVGITDIKVKYVLPEDFGQGWDYDLVHYRRDGSHDKSGNGNFAHEALKIAENNANVSISEDGVTTVDFIAVSLDEAKRAQQHLQHIVDSFPAREPCDVYVQTWPGEESLVTSYAPTLHPGQEQPSSVKNMPLAVYVAKHVPMAELHPELQGKDPEMVSKTFDFDQLDGGGMPAVGDNRTGRRIGG